jgi:hypothetical protein
MENVLPVRLNGSLRSQFTSCPAQWNGQTVDGKDVYVRFRWGVLKVSVGGVCVWEEQVSDDLDGTMDDATMRERLVGVVSAS